MSIISIITNVKEFYVILLPVYVCLIMIDRIFNKISLMLRTSKYYSIWRGNLVEDNLK